MLILALHTNKYKEIVDNNLMYCLIRGWIRKGKEILAHKIVKQWKFRFSELDAWVKSGQSAE